MTFTLPMSAQVATLRSKAIGASEPLNVRIAAGGTAVAQSRPDESAEQNVRSSHQYESLLCNNPGFRAKRIAQERLLSQLQTQVRDLAIDLAEKVVGANLDRQRNLALVDQFIAELSGAK